MVVLRNVKGYELNVGGGMANGLFNVSNEELLKSTNDIGVSNWFDNEIKDMLMGMNDEDFISHSETLINLN